VISAYDAVDGSSTARECHGFGCSCDLEELSMQTITTLGLDIASRFFRCAELTLAVS
jgi:hypothetical protein